MWIALIFIVGFIVGYLIGRLKSYTPNKYVGNIVVKENDEGGKIYSLELNGDPEGLDQFQEVTFRIMVSHEQDV